MDIRKVLSRLVDGSRFNEFKIQWGSTLVTGFAYVQGYFVGIVANAGEVNDTAAAKGAHFVNMCSERNIPLIFLHNSTANTNTPNYGLLGGNILRDHAKMMAAISCARVPKISIVVGNSIGTTNYLMCGRSCSPNFMFTWPNAVVGMLDKTHLVENIIQDKFHDKAASVSERDEMRKKLLERYSVEMSAFYISSRLLDDGIITPQNTRQTIGRCLEITSAYKQHKQTLHNVTRM